MTTAAPIACTLGPAAYRERFAWLAALNRRSLRSHRLAGRTLTLDYAPEAAAEVDELVRRESECCAFLAFDVAGTPGMVHLTVTAPKAAGDDLAPMLLAPFLAGVAPSAGDSADGPSGDSGCASGSCGCSAGASKDDAAASSDRSADAPGGRVPAAAATTAAAAAVACGVCCVLPFFLPAAAMAVLGGAIAAFAHLYRWALYLAIALVGSAWFWTAAQSIRARRRPAPATVRTLIAATVLLGAALSWPMLEPIVGAALGER
jgi:hypothetical protein